MIPGWFKTEIDNWFSAAEGTRKSGEVFIIDLCYDILAHTIELKSTEPINMTEYKQENVDLLACIIYEGHKTWEQAVKYLNEVYHQDQVAFGFLMSIEYLIQNIDKTKTAAVATFRDALTKAMSEIGEDLFSEIDPLEDDISEDELRQTILDNPNLLEAFFRTFRELGTFHRNMNDCKTAEEADLNRKMLSIYRALTKT